MNDGVDPESGVKLCEGAGHFRDMTCYGDVERAWDKIIRNFHEAQRNYRDLL